MTHNNLNVSMMLMHAIHGNGTLIVKVNNNTAEVSSGIYSVNGQERIRKSTIGYKNQNRIYKLMMGLMQKYGVYEYEGNIYRLKGMDHWESDGTNKLVENQELKRSMKWGRTTRLNLSRSNECSEFRNMNYYRSINLPSYTTYDTCNYPKLLLTRFKMTT